MGLPHEFSVIIYKSYCGVGTMKKAKRILSTFTLKNYSYFTARDMLLSDCLLFFKLKILFPSLHVSGKKGDY